MADTLDLARTAGGRGPDLFRMRRDRSAKIQRAMAGQNLDGMLLLSTGSVLYATGAWLLPADNGRQTYERTCALVVRGDEHPHVFAQLPEGLPPELPTDHVHPPLWLESEAGVEDAARRVTEILGRSDGTLALDDYTAPMWFALPKLLAPMELTSAVPLLTECRLHKTVDEQECMRVSWRINEAATAAAERALRPGVRLTDLSGVFYRHMFELGATCNFLDPVFQAMPPSIHDGPWSTNGDVPFALVTADHIVRHGDVVWTDTVMGYEGYASDVGRTWIVGKPSRTMHDLYRRWRDIVDVVIDAIRPGVTGAELCRLAIEANGGTRPWLDHYFLGHTLGLEGGEAQRFGSDAGLAYDEAFVLEPGMAVVLEPVAWQDGHAGYRCEELLFVTENGNEKVSQYPNEPFE